MIIKDILDKHSKWLKGEEGGERANLSYTNLEGANLSYTNLEGANLEGANLSEANLYRANLHRANLEGSNLYRANLEGANLEGANLEGANLYVASLYCANLSEANLEGANLYGASLRFTTGNDKEVKNIKGMFYRITYTDKMLFIGCQGHSIQDWEGFSDEEIDKMDRGKSLKWWKKHKEEVMAIVKGEKE